MTLLILTLSWYHGTAVTTVAVNVENQLGLHNLIAWTPSRGFIIEKAYRCGVCVAHSPRTSKCTFGHTLTSGDAAPKFSVNDVTRSMFSETLKKRIQVTCPTNVTAALSARKPSVLCTLATGLIAPSFSSVAILNVWQIWQTDWMLRWID